MVEKNETGSGRLPTILLIANLPLYGGTTTYIESLAEVLLSKGCRIILLGSEGGITSLRKWEAYETATVDGRGRQIVFLTKLFAKLLSMWKLREYNDLVIHANIPEEALLAMLIFRKRAIVCTLHGKYFESIRRRHSRSVLRIYQIVEKISFALLRKRHAVIVSVDESTRDYYCSRHPRLVDSMRVIPVGVDINKFRPMSKVEVRKKHGFPEDEKIVMYVGRLAVEKNLLFLVRAFALLKNQMQEVRLVLIGDGTERANIECEAKRLGIERHIFLYGKVAYKEMPEIINCADVIALCSHHEGSPHIFREAVACKIPIVSTRIGDAEKIIISSNIGRISNSDEKAFAGHLLTAIKNYERCGNHPAGLISELSIDRMADDYVDVFRRLI
jgi:L-malate glycosyltransferase